MTEPAAADPAPSTPGSKLGDFVQLMKPRLTALVITTAAVGFFVASPEQANLLTGALMAAGLICVVGGGNALNQYWEREIDARMKRTRNRPLPQRSLTPREAMIFGVLNRRYGAV